MRPFQSFIRNHLAFAALLLSYAISPSPSAHAWGRLGHRVVGELAELILKERDPAAAAKARAVLRGSSLADVANWADEIKSTPQSNIYLPQWHFINIADGLTLKTTPRRPSGDILTAMEKAEKIFGDPKADPQLRQDWLRLFVHYVGDIQQPLHVSRPAGDFYDECKLPRPPKDTPMDMGGNTIAVIWADRLTNLHAVWDEDLVQADTGSYSEIAQELFRSLHGQIPETQANEWATTPMEGWIDEAMAARESVYDPKNWGTVGDASTRHRVAFFESMGAPRGTPILSGKYQYRFQETAKRRLLVGGLRLAERIHRVFSAGAN